MIQSNSASDEITTPSITPPSTGTACCWMSIDTLSATSQRFFGNGNAFEFRTDTSSPYDLISDMGTTGTGPQGAISSATLFHAATTWTPSVGTVELFINAVSQGTAVTDSSPGANAITFFSRNGTGHLIGSAGDFRLYSRVLSQKEISEIYFTRGADRVSDWTDRWRCIDGVGTVTGASVRNLATSARNATASSTPLWVPSPLKFGRAS